MLFLIIQIKKIQIAIIL